MLRDKKVLSSVWLVAAVNGILFSYYAEAPFIFINLVGLTASKYGWLGSLIALAALTGSLTCRHLSKNFSAKKIIVIGCIIMLFSSILMTLGCLVSPQNKIIASLVIILPMMGIIFGGFGLIIPMTLADALQKYSAAFGSAGAIFGLAYYIVIAIITWFMGFFHNGTIYPIPYYFLALSTLSFFVAMSLKS